MTAQAERITEKIGGEKPPEQVVGKAAEKPAEKRRALGRGLESLLPGRPRAVTLPAPPAVQDLEPTATQDGRVQDVSAAGSGQALATAGATPALPGESAPATGILADLHAMAARRTPGGPVVHPSPPRLAVPGATIAEIPLDQIDANPHQTRTDFEEEFLKELAASIRAQGVIQPIVVRPGKDGRYLLVLGERRVRASRMAGKTTIPAVVKRVSEQQAAEMTLVENLQRQDLHCLDQAAAFAHLSEEFNLTQEEIGKRVGASRETVSNYMRLLRLPGPVQTYLQRGELTFSHARELLVLDDDEQIWKVAEKAVKEKMSVDLLENFILDLKWQVEKQGPEKVRHGARWVDPNVRAQQRSLEAVLGMKVRIRDRRGKGKITIEYASLEDFDRVVGMLKGKTSSQ